MIPQAYPIELAQFVISITGWCYNLRMLFDVYQDRTLLIATGKNGRRMITANSEIEQEWYRVVITTSLLLFGLYSIITEPPTVIPVLLPLFIEHNVTVLRYILIVITILIAFKSHRARRTRQRLDAYPEAETYKDRRRHDFGPPFAMEERRKKTIPPE
jgi:hypothetical protein